MTTAYFLFARINQAKVPHFCFDMSLQISKLSQRSRDKRILRDVSFNVERGKVLGLFGVSGSGKTTILKAVAGLDKAGGSISFDSNDVTGLARDVRNFHFAAPPARSFLGGFVKNDSSTQLSSGERAAVMIADALESINEVLLLDDPFCSMDDFLKQEFSQKLRKLVESRNLSVVLATSSYEDVLTHCDSVALLAGGEIIQTGTPQQVYSNPISYEAARITGANNLFEARRFTSNKSENPQFQTLFGEHRLGVEKMERSALGAINQNVWLGIRPEHVSIAFGASFPEDNLLKAVITGVHLLGSTTIVELDAKGLKLSALVLRLVGLSVGDECMLGLPTDRIQVFKS